MTNGTHELDLLIKNVRVARPGGDGLEDLDIGIRGGRFASLAPNIDVALAAETYDARNRIAFPGVVDPHMHCGSTVRWSRTRKPRAGLRPRAA